MTRTMTQQRPHTPDLAYLSNTAALPAVSTVLVRAAVTWAKWRQTARTRKTLSDLDPHLLRDVGIPFEEAFREARKPFWMR